MNLLEYDYSGLEKIISGGQMGADLGALLAAWQLGVPTGGVAPRGWMTCRGPLVSLAELGLVESTGGYNQRTIENIDSSDATLIIASNLESPGTKLTIATCAKRAKPLHIYKNRTAVVDWVKQHRVKVLNCAGNRDRAGDAHLDRAFEAVSNLIFDLQQARLLNLKLNK